MSGLESIANLTLGKEAVLPGKPGHGGEAPAHPFLAVLDAIIASNPGQAEAAGQPPGQALRQIAAAAMGETALVAPEPVRGLPTIEAAVEALAEERAAAGDGAIDEEAINRLLDRLLAENAATDPAADDAAQRSTAAGPAVEAGQEEGQPAAAPSLEEMILAAVAAMQSAGENQNAPGRANDAAQQVADQRVPEHVMAALREKLDPRARPGQASTRNGGDEQPEARRTADIARASESDLLQRLREGLASQQAGKDRPAQAQTQGQAQPAQPEVVSSALSTVQDLGEDLSGRTRIAMPTGNPGAGGPAYSADAAGSNATSPMRAAIPALALEVASQARNGNRHFEIRLEPPELGRIEVRLDFARDGQMTTRMLVERPETLDMLMRDARGLEKALQANGLKVEDGAVQYQLRDQSAFERQENMSREGNAGTGDSSEGNRTDDQADEPAPEAGPWRRVAAGGLDMRV